MTEEWFKSNIKKYMPEIDLFNYEYVIYGRFKANSNTVLIRYVKSRKELNIPFDIDLDEDYHIIPVDEKNNFTNNWDKDLLFFEESDEEIKQMLKLHKRYKQLICNIKKNELEKDFE